MSNSEIVRQFIVDTTGKQIGVILPIEEYQALVRLQAGFTRRPRLRTRPALKPLYGVLRDLGRNGRAYGRDGCDPSRALGGVGRERQLMILADGQPGYVVKVDRQAISLGGQESLV